jgi:hypothetical protein
LQILIESILYPDRNGGKLHQVWIDPFTNQCLNSSYRQNFRIFALVLPQRMQLRGILHSTSDRTTETSHHLSLISLWEGVIARQVGDRYQTAFGHHSIEAAKREGLTEAAIILRDLDDEQMLQFMRRENMSDYNADFLTMLQTWDAAVQHRESKLIYQTDFVPMQAMPSKY